MWEDDGNIQRVEIEQTAMVFFKTIYTRMHVLQARSLRRSTCMPVQDSACLMSCLQILAYHLQSSLAMVCQWNSVCLRVKQYSTLTSSLLKPWHRGE